MGKQRSYRRRDIRAQKSQVRRAPASETQPGGVSINPQALARLRTLQNKIKEIDNGRE